MDSRGFFVGQNPWDPFLSARVSKCDICNAIAAKWPFVAQPKQEKSMCFRYVLRPTWLWTPKTGSNLRHACSWPGMSLLREQATLRGQLVAGFADRPRVSGKARCVFGRLVAGISPAARLAFAPFLGNSSAERHHSWAGGGENQCQGRRKPQPAQVSRRSLPYPHERHDRQNAGRGHENNKPPVARRGARRKRRQASEKDQSRIPGAKTTALPHRPS